MEPLSINFERNCRYPCTTDDIDGLGNCICDRQKKALPRVELFSLVGALNKQKVRLRQIELQYLDERSMKCIAISDALCSLDAAIKKLKKLLVPETKKNTMDEIKVSLSPDELIVIHNILVTVSGMKDFRNNCISKEIKNPFFWPNLIQKVKNNINDVSISKYCIDDPQTF